MFFIFNTNPRFPPFLLYVRCKSGVIFIRRSFRDEQSETHTRAIECMTHSMSMMRDTSGRQSEAHIRAISECISRSMSMMKDTCELVKECVKVVADSTQKTFNNF